MHTARLRPRSAGAQAQLACDDIPVEVISVKFRPQQVKAATATTEYAAVTNSRAQPPRPPSGAFSLRSLCSYPGEHAIRILHRAIHRHTRRRLHAPTESAPTTYRAEQRRTQTPQNHALLPPFFHVYRLHLRAAGATATSTQHADATTTVVAVTTVVLAPNLRRPWRLHRSPEIVAAVATSTGTHVRRPLEPAHHPC